MQPADSVHPDRDEHIEVFVEEWLTDEDYQTAKDTQQLAWQQAVTRKSSPTETLSRRVRTAEKLGEDRQIGAYSRTANDALTLLCDRMPKLEARPSVCRCAAVTAARRRCEGGRRDHMHPGSGDGQKDGRKGASLNGYRGVRGPDVFHSIAHASTCAYTTGIRLAMVCGVQRRAVGARADGNTPLEANSTRTEGTHC